MAEYVPRQGQVHMSQCEIKNHAMMRRDDIVKVKMM